MSGSSTGFPFPMISSSSACAFLSFSGLRSSSVIAHSRVLDVVSVPAVNKSCKKGGVKVCELEVVHRSGLTK